MTETPMHPEEVGAADLLRPLALVAIGRTGADIERIVRETRRGVRRAKRELTWADLEAALTADNRPATPDARWRVAVHEAGHALVWVALGIGRIESVMIKQAMGNALVGRPRTDVADTEEWLHRSIAAYLGGRTAELVILGNATAGAGGNEASDLAQVTKFALDAETSWGFSRRHPLIYRPPTDPTAALTFGGDLASRVDARLRSAEALARSVIESNREKLLTLAQRLDKQGVMEGAEVVDVLGELVVPETKE